jgi:hypothetical protein
MGNDRVFKNTRMGGGDSGAAAQSLKTFALCMALAAALMAVFWYGGMQAESSSPEPFLSSELLRAMRHRDRAAFIRELDRLPSVNAPDAEGMTALLTVACCGGDVEDLTSVLARGADVNRAHWVRGTPLMAILMRRDAAATRLLLRNGADAGQLVRNGDCPLLAAIRGGSEECINLTLAAQARGGAELFPPGMLDNPLNCAASDDAQEPVLRRLLAAGVDPNRPGANGQLPLVTALLTGSERSAALLLSAGANVDLPDGRGRIARALTESDGRLATAYPPNHSGPGARADARTARRRL